MSIMGLVLIILYIAITIKNILARNDSFSRIKWDYFKIAIAIPLFTNIGTVIGNISFSSFSIMAYFIVAILEFILQKKRGIKRDIFFWLSILSFILFLGLIRLSLSDNMPNIIPRTTVMDDVFGGGASVSRATFSKMNITTYIEMLIWSLSLCLSYGELRNREKTHELMGFIQKCFFIFFIIVTLEFILNNLFNARNVRDLVLDIMGVVDRSKIYYPQSRFGFYNFDGLYSEQSYISMMLVYYGIVYINGLTTAKERLFFVWSILVLVMSTSTTGYYYFILVILVILHMILPNRVKTMSTKARRRLLVFLSLFIIVSASAMLTNAEALNRVYSSLALKLSAFIYGSAPTSNTVINSGAIRNYANRIALQAFLNKPLLGVGIGTTRAYGIWAGMLPCFGILGVIAYFAFCNSIFRFSFKNKISLAISIIVLFYVILSVNFLYSMAMVPFLMLLSRNYVGEYNVSK